MCKEALPSRQRRADGDPRARHDFVLGHINIDLAIIFGELPGAVFSYGAQKAMKQVQKDLFQLDWKKVFERDAVWQSIREISTPRRVRMRLRHQLTFLACCVSAWAGCGVAVVRRCRVRRYGRKPGRQYLAHLLLVRHGLPVDSPRRDARNHFGGTARRDQLSLRPRRAGQDRLPSPAQTCIARPAMSIAPPSTSLDLR